MKLKKLLKKYRQSGAAAKLLLVLAAVVLVAIVLAFLFVKMATKPPQPVQNGPAVVPLPVYEKQLGNIRFVFESASDRGNALKISDLVNKDYVAQNDLTTTEKFISVTIGAQNKGTVNTETGAWDIGNIIDSDGRNFVPVDSYMVNGWLPKGNSCGQLLKPAFDPTPCTKIYEVAKESKGLQVEVQTGMNNNSASDMSAGKKLTFDLDMIVK